MYPTQPQAAAAAAPTAAADGAATSCCGSSCGHSTRQQDHASQEADSSQMEAECCWICMAGPEAGCLVQPCTCPRSVHPSCLSRWQLQQAGREEERTCRFCQADLPDWRLAHAGLPTAVPIMTVVHCGVTHQVAVNPGQEGRTEFLNTIKRIYGLGEDDEVALTFGCKVPGSVVEDIQLEGAACFDAAVHLASISAGERMRKRQQREQQQGQEQQGCQPQAEAGQCQQQSMQTAAAADGSGSEHKSPRSIMKAVMDLFW